MSHHTQSNYMSLYYLKRSERETQKKTQNSYGEILTGFNECLDAFIKLPYCFGKIEDPNTDRGNYQYICTVHYLQGAYTFWAFTSLFERGYYLESTILCRHLWETFIQMKYYGKYPNKIMSGYEHTCELLDIKDVIIKRSEFRECDGKMLRVAHGVFQNEKSKHCDQSYGYLSDIWTTDSARSHCKSNQGKFQKAYRPNFRIMFDEFAKGFYTDHYSNLCEAAHGSIFKSLSRIDRKQSRVVMGCKFDLKQADFVIIQGIILLYGFFNMFDKIFDNNILKSDQQILQNMEDSKVWLKELMDKHKKQFPKTADWYCHVDNLIL